MRPTAYMALVPALALTLVLALPRASAAHGLPDPLAKSRKTTASQRALHPTAASRQKSRRPATSARSAARGKRRESPPVPEKISAHKRAATREDASTRKHLTSAAALPSPIRQPSHSHQARLSDSSRKPATAAAPPAPADIGADPSQDTRADPRQDTEIASSDPPAETAASSHDASLEGVSLRKTRAIMPPPMRGNYESLVRQNDKTEADGLERIEDDDDLADRIARKMLVPVPVSPALTINGSLPENRRYCRPWTATFLADLARAHAAQFHGPLEVSSAVRTVAYQKELAKTNGNAAAAEGDIASPHLTGATIDIAKQGLTRQEIGWMRARLLPLQASGKIDVEEEFQQSCFHITVYKSYVPPKPRKLPAQASVGPAKTGLTRTAQGKAAQARPEHSNPPQTKSAQPMPATPKRERPSQPPPPPAAPDEAAVEG
jgi:hypothetical protein